MIQIDLPTINPKTTAMMVKTKSRSFLTRDHILSPKFLITDVSMLMT